MRIQCERCATTYELDERRLPANGALVKCTRCEHVFRAVPPSAEAPPPVPPQDPNPRVAAVPTPASPGESGARGRSRRTWFLVATVLAALALAAAWYVAQRRVATPTTRLPAGVEFLPT